MDQEFIELYSEEVVWHQVEKAWLPKWSVFARRDGFLERQPQAISAAVQTVPRTQETTDEKPEGIHEEQIRSRGM